MNEKKRYYNIDIIIITDNYYNDDVYKNNFDNDNVYKINCVNGDSNNYHDNLNTIIIQKVDKDYNNNTKNVSNRNSDSDNNNNNIFKNNNTSTIICNR